MLRHDDGVGFYISQRIKLCDKIKTLTVAQSIENYIGKINAMNPDLLILIDCVDFKQTPGFIRLIALEELVDRTTNTHTILLVKLQEFFTMPIQILGTQPEQVTFGEGLSDCVAVMADDLIEVLQDKMPVS